MAASIGVYGALVLVGGYLLLWRSKVYGIVYQLLLAGLLATIVGRLIEQMVGIARVSDLTLFWVLLAVFAALPAIMGGQQIAMEGQQTAPDPVPQRSSRRRKLNRPSSDSVPKEGRHQWWFAGKLVVTGALVVGIGLLTWVKGIDYVRAAVIADRAAEQLQAGEAQSALSSLERSISLAPDVSSYYVNRANIYLAMLERGAVSVHMKCGGLAELPARNVCLAEEAHNGNKQWVENRPLSYKSRFALATSAFQLAVASNDADVAQDSIRLHRETAQMLPTSFAAWNRLADVSIVVGQPQEALEALDKALALLGDSEDAVSALLLQAEAYQNLGQFEPELESLERAIKISPEDPRLYYIRGSTYRLLDQHANAIEDLNKAIELAPGDAEAYRSRALAFANLGREAEAGEDLERAVDLGMDRNSLVAAIEEVKMSRE